jgi:hypothetical protein
MDAFFKKLSYRHKNNKFLYYSSNLLRLLLPNFIFQVRLSGKLAEIKNYDLEYVKRRVNYYNKLSGGIKLRDDKNRLSDFKFGRKSKVYFFDSQEYTRYFSSNLRINFLFGDITYVPEEPSIIKSRPIDGDNSNSVVLKLNKVRHFIFTKDEKEFVKKRDLLVGRGRIVRTHRVRFFEMYFGHPLCDIGHTAKDSISDHWRKGKLTLDEQLDYKFILCLEGNDVASNLKWVMSSNSIAVMPKPKYETWFMEGTLKPDYHYIAIKDDYSDFEEKIRYYIEHTDEALKIVANANAYIEQFKDTKREDLISLLVLQKYFYKTGQLSVKDESIFN